VEISAESRGTGTDGGNKGCRCHRVTTASVDRHRRWNFAKTQLWVVVQIDLTEARQFTKRAGELLQAVATEGEHFEQP
jgi:hypothetical protein